MGCFSSAVECRTRNHVSPCSNLLCYRFEDWAFSFSPLTPLFTQLYKWVPGCRQRWKYEWIVFVSNCCVARMLPVELVSEWTGLPGRAISVKRFEWSNGLDTALYKTYLLHCSVGHGTVCSLHCPGASPESQGVDAVTRRTPRLWCLLGKNFHFCHRVNCAVIRVRTDPQIILNDVEFDCFKYPLMSLNVL